MQATLFFMFFITNHGIKPFVKNFDYLFMFYFVLLAYEKDTYIVNI